MKECKEHKFLADNKLKIMIQADWGVCPGEPENYWSVWIENMNTGKSEVGATEDGRTSMKSLTELIQSLIEEWKREKLPKRRKKKEKK